VTLQSVLDLLMDKLHFRYDQYDRWEKMITACLIERGYTKVKWFNEDSDSSGPLIRGLAAINPHRIEETAYYG
jgi:hypothetical protein